MFKTVLILFLTFSINAIADKTTLLTQGKAINSDGKLVYIEQHESVINEGKLYKLTTNYLDAKGKQFGHIKTDYSLNSGIPNYEFIDNRNGRFVSVELQDKKVIAKTKTKKDEPKETNTYDLESNMVAGQGLYAFLYNNLEKFIQNSDHIENVLFLIPLNEDTYKFRIRKLKKDNDIITLRLEADSWFFRLIAPHIDVTYNMINKKLLKYEGPSNLLSESGEAMNVSISYTDRENKDLKTGIKEARND